MSHESSIQCGTPFPTGRMVELVNEEVGTVTQCVSICYLHVSDQRCHTIATFRVHYGTPERHCRNYNLVHWHYQDRYP